MEPSGGQQTRCSRGKSSTREETRRPGGLRRRTVLQTVAGAAFAATSVGVTPAPATARATDETVYLGSSDGSLFAVDAASGEQLWRFDDPDDELRSSPTVVGGTVYVGSSDATLYAVDGETGEERWRFTEPPGGVQSSPTVVDGTVYVGSSLGGKPDVPTLFAVDAESGEAEWSSRDLGAVNRSPAVVDGTVYAGSASQTLGAFDASDGTADWVVGGADQSASGSPQPTGEGVIVPGMDYAVHALDPADGDELWHNPDPEWYLWSAPVAVDGTVYVGTEREGLLAIDAAEGETEWVFDDPPLAVRGAPTVDDGLVFVTSRYLPIEPAPVVWAVDADSGSLEWDYEHEAGADSSPTVAGETLYVGTNDGVLLALEAATGERQWRFDHPEAETWFESSPTVVADPGGGDSIDTRVEQGALGHHHTFADRVTEQGGGSTDGDVFGPGMGVGAALSGLAGGALLRWCRSSNTA